MAQNIGWIKLERHLTNKTFSNNVQLNTDCYVVYSYLCEKAAWGEYDGLTRGQLRFKAKDIHNDILPNMLIDRIRKIVRILAEKNYIKSTQISSSSCDGFLIEICHYDDFGGESCQNACNPTETQLKPNCNPTETQLKPVILDKHEESLDKNHVNTATCNPTETQLKPNCNPTETQLKPQGVFLFIEERNKEEKEEKEVLNSVAIADALAAPNSQSIIPNDPIKKPRKRKNDTVDEVPVDLIPARDTFYRCYQERYGVKPLINCKVIKHIKDLIKRCENNVDDACRLIAFYLTHNNSFYLSKAHSIEYALKDCEKLFTEMSKKDYIFNKDARKVEDATTNSILLNQILENNRRKRENE